MFAGTERFEIVRRIGEGGMGVVYEAFDREQGAQVALKTIRDISPQSLYRLKNEFRSLVDLRHPNLIELGELCEDGGEWFFTMELVRGVDIVTHLRRADPARVDEGRVRAVFAQLVDALVTLHRAGLIHRDIKPSNVLVTDAGRLVLLDFGLATGLAAEQSTDGGIVGTAAYMAPEQAAAKIVGAEADWYSFGVLLYEVLCGRTPFEGPTLKVLVDKQQQQPPRVRSLAREVAEDLDELCARLLAFAPEERPGEDKINRVLAPDPGAPRRGLSSSATIIAPFVGRTRELAELGESLAAVRAGDCATVVISGASGVGKSTLVHTFVKSVGCELPEVVVLAGRCYESETVPFKAVDGVIDSLSRYLRRQTGAIDAVLPLEAALLPRVFPVLGRVEKLARAPSPRRPAADAHELRIRVFKALRELLHRLAMRVPLIITIDDLQWADADSLNLIRALVAPPDAPPMLVLATLRAVARPQAWTVATLAIPGRFRELGLGHLGDDDARKLVELLLENVGAEADPERIAREAEGHPLFIDELVRHLATSSESRGPVRLDQAIWHRINALAEKPRQIVELVAIAAAPLAADVIRRAARADAKAFRRQIAVLRVSHLVSATGSRNSDLLEPYHDRVREAVVTNLSGEVRTELHRRLASAIETAGRAELHAEFLVHHLEGAGELGRAAEQSRLALHHGVDRWRRHHRERIEHRGAAAAQRYLGQLGTRRFRGAGSSGAGSAIARSDRSRAARRGPPGCREPHPGPAGRNPRRACAPPGAGTWPGSWPRVQRGRPRLRRRADRGARLAQDR